MHYVVALQDRGLGAYARQLKALGTQGRVVLAGALNQAAAEVRARTVAAETKQTGLPARTIDKAQKPIEATPASLTYVIKAEGGDVRLKYFGAQETDGGVLAHPFGRNQVFAHAFMAGGRFPNRVTIGKLHGAVIERIGVRGKDKPWSRTVRSGLLIPDEMTKGSTAAAFETGVTTIVAPVVVRKLGAMLSP